jgi:hypothetical protein
MKTVDFIHKAVKPAWKIAVILLLLQPKSKNSNSKIPNPKRIRNLEFVF